jgi:hypothetical protein
MNASLQRLARTGLACLILLAGATAPEAAGASDTAPAQLSGSSIATGWITNTTTTSPVFGSLVNVQSVATSGSTVTVTTTDIPSYATTITSSILSSLNSHSSSDYRSGATTATLNQTVNFGADIGFKTAASCTGKAGYGYWPPGPACATAQTHSFSFPLTPTKATTLTSTSSAEIGLFLNGTSIFNWSDANTYNNRGVWHNTAVAFEGNTMDICNGHSANGDYHHHFYSNCLATQLNDDGSGHSPIYGYAFDGYPIYGPWTAAGTLAKSGWKTRSYLASSATGCGVDYARSCLMVDQTDPSKGTTTASSNGPSTQGSATNLLNQSVAAVSGIYAEDYYYDTSCGDCLDVHNGIDDNDGRGYHYVLTVTQNADGSLSPAFPYILGLTYAGVPHGSSSGGGLATVTKVSPAYGSPSGGTKVTLTGTNFSGATAVLFGSTAGTVQSINKAGTQIVATAPAGTDSVHVTVTNATGTNSAGTADTFSYLPQLTKISPSSGAAGAKITLTGTNLKTVTAVSFGGVAATNVKAVSDTSVTATVPASSGTVSLTLTSPGGTSATVTKGAFTYSAPAIKSISPKYGADTGGKTVTFTGTNLGGVATVVFGARTATATVVSQTKLTAVAPVGTGTVTLGANWAGGLVSAPASLTYSYAPAVTSISKRTGPAAGGTTVTVSGHNLSDVTAVLFDTTSVAATVISDSKVQATSPAGTGTVNVTVVDSGGDQSATAKGATFTYTST